MSVGVVMLMEGVCRESKQADADCDDFEEKQGQVAGFLEGFP